MHRLTGTWAQGWSIDKGPALKQTRPGRDAQPLQVGIGRAGGLRCPLEQRARDLSIIFFFFVSVRLRLHHIAAAPLHKRTGSPSWSAAPSCASSAAVVRHVAATHMSLGPWHPMTCFFATSCRRRPRWLDQDFQKPSSLNGKPGPCALPSRAVHIASSSTQQRLLIIYQCAIP